MISTKFTSQGLRRLGAINSDIGSFPRKNDRLRRMKEAMHFQHANLLRNYLQNLSQGIRGFIHVYLCLFSLCLNRRPQIFFRFDSGFRLQLQLGLHFIKAVEHRMLHLAVTARTRKPSSEFIVMQIVLHSVFLLQVQHNWSVQQSTLRVRQTKLSNVLIPLLISTYLWLVSTRMQTTALKCKLLHLNRWQRQLRNVKSNQELFATELR